MPHLHDDHSQVMDEAVAAIVAFGILALACPWISALLPTTFAKEQRKIMSGRIFNRLREDCDD